MFTCATTHSYPSPISEMHNNEGITNLNLELIGIYCRSLELSLIETCRVGSSPKEVASLQLQERCIATNFCLCTHTNNITLLIHIVKVAIYSSQLSRVSIGGFLKLAYCFLFYGVGTVEVRILAALLL